MELVGRVVGMTCHGGGCSLLAKVLGPALPLFLGHEALGKSPGSLVSSSGRGGKTSVSGYGEA